MALIVQEAHLRELNTSTEQYNREVVSRFLSSQQEFREQLNDIAQARAERRPVPYRRHEIVAPLLLARREAAESLDGEEEHRLLAAEPLAPVRQMSRRIFEELTDEDFAEGRQRVVVAARKLALARKLGRPIVLILYRGHGEFKDEYDESTKRLLSDLTRHPASRKALRSSVMVTLPRRQLPALMQLVDLPQYEESRRSSASVIVARPDGEQVAALAGHADPRQVADFLRPMIIAGTMKNAAPLVGPGIIPFK